MTDRRLVFLGPGAVDVEPFDAGQPGAGEVRLKTLTTAVSAGTESLLWRGTWPEEMALDGLWSPQAGSARYPVCYGYASVGRVEALGPGVDPAWLGTRAFTFTGHQTRSVVPVSTLIPLPVALDTEDGVFTAALETALTLAQDAAPVAGETVGVWGLGTIGVLTATVLTGPFTVLAWDNEAYRREGAAAFGAGTTARPATRSCDAVIELTGNPQALDDALGAVRFSGRLVIGSWYGSRPVPLRLGGDFHRSRIEMVSSQVSTLAPGLSGRWTKARRLETAVALAGRLRPSRLVTHRFPLGDASAAYRQACDLPSQGRQVLFTYD